jgi:hypothetical protein
VGSASYVINGAAATPTFSPAGGSYASAQSVTISDSTSGATIYYTTNGTTPTTSSAVYTSPITVSTTETLEAIATASGYSQSAVGSASYTIGGGGSTISLVQEKVLSNGGGQIACNPTCPALTVNATSAGDLLLISAVATGTGGGVQTNISSISCSPSCGAWVIPGASCRNYSANTGGVDCGYVLSSAAGATSVTVTMSGTTPYGTVYFREYHTTQSTGFRFDQVGTALSSACTSCVTPTLTLTGGNDVLVASGAPGGGFTAISAPYGNVQTESYTVTAVGDRLNTSSGTGATITQNANDPAILSTIAFTDTPLVAATPTFSPAGGTYSTAQSVTISDSTSGSTIYYTTDGSTPTTSSSVYSAPISVSVSKTLKAIATASGYSQSAVGSATYTINSGTLANGTYTITNVNSGLVMDVYQNSTTPGTQIDQYTSNGQSNQHWQVTSLGGGLYKLVAVSSGLCLDVYGQSLSNGGLIDEYTCNGGTNQQFTISQVSGHTYYTIVGKQSGLAVEVPGSSTTPGTFLDQSTLTTGANQEWTFQ